MYNNQYDRKIVRATENAIKTQKDFLLMSISSIVYIIL
jgi:hypothetical protein